MLRRYVAGTTTLVVLALVVGYVVFLATRVDYAAVCLDQVALPVSSATGPDYFTASQTMAKTETELAVATGLYTAVGQKAGVPAATVSADIGFFPSSSDDTVSVSGQGSSAEAAARLANAGCQALAEAIVKQRTQLNLAEATGLRARMSALQTEIDALNAVPAGQRTLTDDTTLKADQQALDHDRTLLGATLGTPPDVVRVVALSPGGQLNDRRSLGRNLLVAGVVGLLVGFVGILGSEMVMARRRQA